MTRNAKASREGTALDERLLDDALILGTIYSGPEDTFERLASYGADEKLLKLLNPHVTHLKELEPGIPLDVPLAVRHQIVPTRLFRGGLDPYDIARRELQLGVREDSRPGHDNPRIRAYHATTVGGAMPDEVAWCSSFVNYCVEQAGLRGTDSKVARSWRLWGQEVSRNDWKEGDIVVFWRGSAGGTKGHVAFLVSWDGDRPYVLGGNQSNRVCIDEPYSFGHILSVRRA
ncbi:TIGR02594 family protein [Rhizobium lentis]|uniref:TIGR02594 family protein n=1 Tax=Rhizobium lentis TaxID=1138194 RepID=UPI001C83B212|nr:TIGR02594 family protein [Rhizobium lentis]